MAHTGEEAPAKEWEDSASDLSAKLDAVAALIKRSKSMVVYTGAGISTAAGIPDYRGSGGMDANGWLSAIQGFGVGTGAADVRRPTYAHMAVTALHAAGKVTAVVTSNHDNFHVQSGLPPNAIVEIFGCANVETCTKCNKSYRRHVRTLRRCVRFGSACAAGAVR